MRGRKGFTLIELLVVIAVIAMLLAILMPPRCKVKTIAQRVVCGTNLKGLGTAITVYVNDYDEKYPQLGKGPWAKGLGYSYEDSEFRPSDYEGDCTITSSLYLLVREADVSPKSFVCPISEHVEFDGRNAKNRDIVELWDFGPTPHDYVSYAYHNPYGKFPANGKRSAAFAVMADMNPWFKDGDTISAGDNNAPPQIITIAQDPRRTDPDILKLGNFQLHRKRTEKLGQGQNVLFADGHSSFEKQPNVGVENDNIYTYWSSEEDPTEQDKQGGTAPTGRGPENDAKSKDDSFLVI